MNQNRKRDRRLQEWTTRDLLIVAALGIVPGLTLIPVVFAGFALRAAIGPLATVVYSGLLYLPGLMSLYIIRRPGASILNGVFVGLVWIPFTPFGLAATIPTIVARIGSEIPFALGRYRRFDLSLLLLGGASAGLFSLAVVYVPFGYQNLAVPLQVGLIVGHTIGGALLSGLLAKVLSDKLVAAGTLTSYPIAYNDHHDQ